MLYTNAKVFTPAGFVPGGFRVEDGRFAEVFEGERLVGEDLGGALVIPGLVDIHTHGAMGADFSDGDPEGLRSMAAHLARCGVTSFAPTSMTLPYETFAAAFQTAMSLAEDRPADCARVMGIHMEGPFFSEKKKGAISSVFKRGPGKALVVTRKMMRHIVTHSSLRAALLINFPGFSWPHKAMNALADL